MSNPRPSAATSPGDNDLLSAAETVGTNLARVSAFVVSWPFYILPVDSRKEAIQATTNLFEAVGELHLELVKTVLSGLSAVTRELGRAVSEPGPLSSKPSTKIPIETATK
jgi:hypothetical protein